LEILAATAVADGDISRAACLSSAVEAIWEALHVARPSAQHTFITHAQTQESLRRQLSNAELAAAREQGRTMSLDAIVAFALHCRGTATAVA
jgi:hypothetical protein